MGPMAIRIELFVSLFRCETYVKLVLPMKNLATPLLILLIGTMASSHAVMVIGTEENANPQRYLHPPGTIALDPDPLKTTTLIKGMTVLDLEKKSGQKIVLPKDLYGIVKTAKTNQVTIVGYSHYPESKVPDLLHNLIADLKKAGITHLILEMTPYAFSILEKEKFAYDRYGPWGSNYGPMALAFKKAGIELIAPDLKDPSPDHPEWHETINGHEFTTPLGMEGQEVHLRQRNENFISTIADIIKKDPKAKVLVFIGAAHNDPISKGLAEKKITVGAIDTTLQRK